MCGADCELAAAGEVSLMDVAELMSEHEGDSGVESTNSADACMLYIRIAVPDLNIQVSLYLRGGPENSTPLPIINTSYYIAQPIRGSGRLGRGGGGQLTP